MQTIRGAETELMLLHYVCENGVKMDRDSRCLRRKAPLQGGGRSHTVDKPFFPIASQRVEGKGREI